MRINLRDFYPFYETDEFTEVPESIYEMLLYWKRKDDAHLRRLRRNKAYYSLDMGDRLLEKAIQTSSSPYEILATRLEKLRLYEAIAGLPDKQAKRLYAYFFLDMNVYEIADAENISHQTVNKSILRALALLKKNLKNLL